MTAAKARYRLAGLIKRGGTAEVHDAYLMGEHGFERRVALKKLLPDTSGDEGFSRSFIDEARLASQLHHAGIVSILDFGVMDDQPFMVLERVDGEDLESLLARSAIPLAAAIHVATEIAHALAHAHRAKDASGRPLGIVHRDVSPENVLLSWEGDVKLTDFGIAFARRRIEATKIGVTKGKLAYMAPEQMRGDAVDARADLFALGCLLHELVAGKPPDRERAIEIDRRVPPDLATIIERATRFEPQSRYSSAAEMAAACGKALASRLSEDARTVLRSWLETLRPSEAAERPKKGGAFDLDLVLMAVEPVSPNVPRFVSVKERPVERNPVGSTLKSYVIERLIGEGRSSRVFLARHEVLARRSAIKILSIDDPARLERFRLEARALSKIDHPSVVKVLDFGTTDQGETFLAMELVEGESLESVIADEAPLRPERAARIVARIAEGLAAIHRVGLVHRDLKPSDVHLLPGDRVKILDFGFAKSLDDRARLTKVGDRIGSASYAAPELLAKNESTPASDLFSLGVLAFELLRRSRPFAPLAQTHQDAPSLPGSNAIERITTRLLDRDPRKRPNAEEVIAALTASAEPAKKSRAGVVAIASTLVVLVAAFAFVTWLLFRRQTAEPAMVVEPEPVAPVPLAVPKPAAKEEPPPLPAEVLVPEPEPVQPKARPKPKPPKEDAAALEAELDRTLTERGLSRADLDLAGQPAREALEHARTARIDSAMLIRKLSRISAAMTSSEEPIPVEQRLGFERRYLELRARVSGKIADREAEELAREASALEREIARARQR
jgi:serine/threonine protein kinase